MDVIQVKEIRKIIDENGVRLDGRRYDESRPIKIKAGVLKRADGSSYVQWGGNKILAAVHGPREVQPRYKKKLTRALIQCNYNKASFSLSGRKRPGPDRRSNEISIVMSDAFNELVLTEKYPRAAIDIYIEVLQADAGTRCAAMTAASVALANAGIPMRDLLPACAVGKVDGQILLDMDKKEDFFRNAEMSVAIIPRTGEVVLLQMDGHLTKGEFGAGMTLLREACMTIYELQKKALKENLTTEFSLKDMDDEVSSSTWLTPESSIESENKNKTSTDYEDKNESTEESEDETESSTENEDKNESTEESEDETESSIENEDKNESTAESEDKNETSSNDNDDQFMKDEMDWDDLSFLDSPEETDTVEPNQVEGDKEEESSREV